MSRATGWLGRAQRLVERDGGDCVERGYLLVPIMLRHEAAGDWEAAYAAAADAAEIGERFGDADLLALAIHEQGCALIQQERVEEGLGLLDEAMVAVTAGELSPIVTGIVYCSVIMGCQEVYALRRAQEWTAALTRWCEEQPEMVAFSGRCLVHRAEIMELHGAWREALEEARRAHQRCLQGKNQSAAAQAFYRQAEVHRLQGRFSAAEEAYRDASRCGCEPQPGLALLRLAQGNDDAAAAAIRRAVVRPPSPSSARGCCQPTSRSCWPWAMFRRRATLAASSRRSRRATRAACWVRCPRTPRERSTWPKATLGLHCSRCATRGRCGRSSRCRTRPRVRVLLGLACRTLGDDDTAALELEAARDVFAQLGAAPDLAHADSLTRRAASVDARGLTPRELQVLRLLAAGRTNKAIAAELVLSERTVDRHVSNIFTKLGVSSRTAATAYAYKQQLV